MKVKRHPSWRPPAPLTPVRPACDTGAAGGEGEGGGDGGSDGGDGGDCGGGAGEHAPKPLHKPLPAEPYRVTNSVLPAHAQRMRSLFASANGAACRVKREA